MNQQPHYPQTPGPQPAPMYPQGQPMQQPQPAYSPTAHGTGNVAAQLFGGIDSARTSFDSNYMRAGHYLCRIDRIKASTNQGGEPFLATEMTILHCFSDHEAVQVGVLAHAAGEQVTDMKMKKHQSFLGNVRAMIAGLEGMTVEELQQQLGREGKNVEMYMIEVCGAQQPYAGTFVEVYARQIMTRPKPGVPNGTPFTKITYKREVRPSELPGFMPPELLQSFFPGDMLQQLIAQEQAIHGQQATQPTPAPHPAAPAPVQPQAPQQPQYAPPQPGQPG